MKRMNIGLLSQDQESNVQIDENNEALKTDQDLAQIQQSHSEIEEVSQVIEETQQAADTMTNMADKIEQSPKVSQDTVQVAQEAIAYFTMRTGLKMTNLNASMESFSKTNDKEAIVAQMRVAIEGLDKGVEIAQEGIIDRIKNRFSLIFTSAEKLSKELREVSDKYDQAGAKQDVIKDPAFARRINPDAKKTLTDSDVIKFATDINKKVHNPIVISSVKKLTEALRTVIFALKKSGIFIADDKQVKIIKEQTSSISAMYKDIESELGVKRNKNDADVEPLTLANKEKIVKLVDSLLDISEYVKYEEILRDAQQSLLFAVANSSATKLAEADAADNRAVSAANQQAAEVYAIISNLMALRFEVAHACVKYIKASTN
jgi:hypothetical protein